MKLAGFLSGAIVAVILVSVFNIWRAVDDDDLLTAALRDHCLPFVTAGADPFTDIGRAPGVYDDVDLRDGVENGGARLIHDNRFTAQWGVVTGGGKSSRICMINPTYGENTVAAFEVAKDGFLDRYTAVFAPFVPLAPDVDAIDSRPTVMGWYGIGRAQNEGLRVVFTVSPGLVSGVVVMDDLDA